MWHSKVIIFGLGGVGGMEAILCVSKYHVKAVQSNFQAYESLIPDHYGRIRNFVVNPLERKVQQRLNNDLQVRKPFIKGASELLHHRDGVGTRWVFMDNRIDERSHVYIIERIFDKTMMISISHKLIIMHIIVIAYLYLWAIIKMEQD